MKYLLFVFILLYCYTSFGQNQVKGSISVQIHTSDKEKIEDVYLNLLNQKDSSLAKIGISEKNGQATIDDIKPGRYFLTASKVGYEKYTSEVITIDENNNNITLSPIELSKSDHALKEVEISYKKPLIERQFDKLIVNVENSILAAGSSALEVLERAPGVIINNETSILLKSKSGVIIMIDGKISPLSGADLINYLKSVPATNIDKIEIITNPSARYDAAGNSGVINIKFKKDQRQGLNGSITLNYGQGFYSKPSGSANMNYRKNKWNLFGNLSYSEPIGFTHFYINRKFFNSEHSVESIFDQTSFIKQPMKSRNAKIGVDYYMNSRTVVGVLFNGNLFNMRREGNTNALITDAEQTLLYTSSTDNFLKEERFNGFGNFNLKHTFDSTGTELTVDADYGNFNGKIDQNYKVSYFQPDGTQTSEDLVRTDQDGLITVRSFKADFVKPLKQDAKFEAGLKTSFVKTDNDVKFYNIFGNNEVIDSNTSNHFIYDENINAAYISVGKTYKKFDFQVGLRAEQTITNGQQITTGGNFSRSYLYLFPSIFVNRKLSENYQLSLSYSRRIDRPDYRQLNPFKVFTDPPYTYVVGDPALKAVFSNSFESSLTFMNKYIASLSYSQSIDAITDVFIQNDITKVSYQKPANLQNYDQVTLSLVIPFNIKKWLNTNIYADGYWNSYTSKFEGGDLHHENISCYININNSFTLSKNGWSAELVGTYQSPLAWGLFLIDDLGHIGVGLQKTSKDKMSTLKLSVSDIFLTNRINVIVKYQNQDFHTNRTWDARVVNLSYTQRFGSSKIAQARKRNTGVEEEKKRAG